MLSALILLLLACSGRDDAPPARPTVVVVLPLGAPYDERVDAIRAALEPEYAVERLDEASSGVVGAAQALPAAVAALAHVSARAATEAAPTWKAGDLPVLTLSASTDLPRLAPSAPELARCAAGLAADGPTLVVHDGGADGVATADLIAGALGGRVDQVLGIAPDTLSADAARVRQRTTAGVLYAGGLSQGGDLLRLLVLQGFKTPFLAIGEAPDPFFDAVGFDAVGFDAVGVDAVGVDAVGPDPGPGLVVTPDRAPLFQEPLARLTTRLGHGPTGPARTAFDAALVVRAALDLAARGPDGLPRRADVRTALDQVIGVGIGGPLALANGGPTPVQCTAYARVGKDLKALAAAQIGADGGVTQVSLDGTDRLNGTGRAPEGGTPAAQ